MSRMALVVPSRGRPHNIARLQDAMAETCRGDTTLVVGLDEDDPARLAYPPGPEYEVRSDLRRVVAWVNELAVPRAEEYDVIGHIGDDNVPRTAGWDVRLAEALEQVPFAFGNDLYPRAPGSLCCHIFTRSQAVKALGYLGPPSLRHMYVDDVWMAWGRARGIAYLNDVIIEHMHYTVGKSRADVSYLESTSLLDADRAAFEQYIATGGMAADIDKLKAAGL